MLVYNQSGIKKKTKCQPALKLVYNTHWSLQCWYTISLVLKRKPNANSTQTGLKYTLVLTMLVYNQSGIKKKNKCQQHSNWSKIHTGPHNAGIESVWY